MQEIFILKNKLKESNIVCTNNRKKNNIKVSQCGVYLKIVINVSCQIGVEKLPYSVFYMYTLPTKNLDQVNFDGVFSIRPA